MPELFGEYDWWVWIIILLISICLIFLVIQIWGIVQDRNRSKNLDIGEKREEYESRTLTESNDPPVRPQGTWMRPDSEDLQQVNQDIRELRTEIESLKERMGSDAEEIKWLKLLKDRLKKRVERLSEELVDEENWHKLEEREKYLDRFQLALEEIKSAMSQDDRASFDVYVDREVKKPLKQIQDLLKLREIQNASDDPVLLLKGALIGEEVFNASSIASLLRRTRPEQMIRYFLPEIDSRVTQNGQENAQRVFDLMMDLSGDEVEIIGARLGDTFDMRRYQIISQDTSGAQPRDRIVRCLAHGLKNSQTDEIELKAKVVISG